MCKIWGAFKKYSVQESMCVYNSYLVVFFFWLVNTKNNIFTIFKKIYVCVICMFKCLGYIFVLAFGLFFRLLFGVGSGCATFKTNKKLHNNCNCGKQYLMFVKWDCLYVANGMNLWYEPSQNQARFDTIFFF